MQIDDCLIIIVLYINCMQDQEVREGARSRVLHRDFRRTPPIADYGRGVRIFDLNGRSYIDASGGAAVSCLGHSNERILAAMEVQSRKLAYCHNSFLGSESSERLAQKLLEHAPDGFGDGRVAFVSSGSEAMEVALKLARQYHVERGDEGRSHFISRAFSYHGNTLGALSVGGHLQRKRIYEPLLRPAQLIGRCYYYRDHWVGEDPEVYGRRMASELQDALQRLGPESVAAFVAEPVAGATLGSVPPPPGYFREIRRICDEAGILFIADEIMCGMGRCGSMFAIQDEGAVPDIITCAKGLGAGYQPIAATMIRQSVAEQIENGSGRLANGHTYMGHPVACAAALAAVTEIEALLPHVQTLGADLERRLRRVFGDHAHIGDIRGRGLFWTLELVDDRDSKTPFSRDLKVAERLKDEAMRLGLIVYLSSGCADGEEGDHVLLAPPFICSSSELDEIVTTLSKAIENVLTSRKFDE
ncbi:MAG: aspartate aminotransferase family protein [Pseudomonadota bacterium]